MSVPVKPPAGLQRHNSIFYFMSANQPERSFHSNLLHLVEVLSSFPSGDHGCHVPTLDLSQARQLGLHQNGKGLSEHNINSSYGTIPTYSTTQNTTVLSIFVASTCHKPILFTAFLFKLASGLEQQNINATANGQRIAACEVCSVCSTCS